MPVPSIKEEIQETWERINRVFDKSFFPLTFEEIRILNSEFFLGAFLFYTFLLEKKNEEFNLFDIINFGKSRPYIFSYAVLFYYLWRLGLFKVKRILRSIKNEDEILSSLTLVPLTIDSLQKWESESRPAMLKVVGNKSFVCVCEPEFIFKLFLLHFVYDDNFFFPSFFLPKRLKKAFEKKKEVFYQFVHELVKKKLEEIGVKNEENSE